MFLKSFRRTSEIVIPNRGDPATRADVQAALKRLKAISSAAIVLVKKGTAKEQLVIEIDATDPSLQVEKLLLNNPARLDAFYAEVAKKAAKLGNEQ